MQKTGETMYDISQKFAIKTCKNFIKKNRMSFGEQPVAGQLVYLDSKKTKKLMLYQRSSALFDEAQRYIPGGVNSPVRAFRSVGGVPVFMKSAKGAYLTDADDRQYVDYINSWGPAIVGHTHPVVLEAIQKQAESGFFFRCTD